MRVKFSFPYDTKLEPDVVERLSALVGKEVEVVPDDASFGAGELKTHVTYEADLDQLVALLPRGKHALLHGAADVHPIYELKQQVEAMRRRLDQVPTEPGTYVNNRVDVHVPGNALLLIDQVKVCENMCTDALAAELEAGWRIVAACPQPDQRRPDYVLGRRSEEA
jgi:hypothetical protein